MYRYAMGQIAQNLKHKSASFVHNTNEADIVAYFNKEVNLVCMVKGVLPSTSTTVDEDGNTLLFYMANYGVTALLPVMVKMGYDPTHRNNQQQSVLHIACSRALLNSKTMSSVVEFIDTVRAYGDWNDEDKNGQTPLFFLVKMYERWNDVNSSIYPASDFEGNTIALIEKAIAEGANIHHHDHAGNTFVSKATANCLAPFQALIEKQLLEQHVSNDRTRVARKM